MSADRPISGSFNDRDTPEGGGAKKPYEKPSFQREQVFETMALACGKINPSSGACKAVKKNS